MASFTEIHPVDDAVELAEYRRRHELNPISGMSWGGFNVWGDEKSMAEVRAAVHSHGQIEEFRTLIRHQREELGKVHGQNRSMKDKMRRWVLDRRILLTNSELFASEVAAASMWLAEFEKAINEL